MNYCLCHGALSPNEREFLEYLRICKSYHKDRKCNKRNCAILKYYEGRTCENYLKSVFRLISVVHYPKKNRMFSRLTAKTISLNLFF